MSIDGTSSVWDHANPEPPIPRSPHRPIMAPLQRGRTIRNLTAEHAEFAEIQQVLF
jgi:hypothetical protein